VLAATAPSATNRKTLRRVIRWFSCMSRIPSRTLNNLYQVSHDSGLIEYQQPKRVCVVRDDI
jgi:hypothetical protein